MRGQGNDIYGLREWPNAGKCDLSENMKPLISNRMVRLV